MLFQNLSTKIGIHSYPSQQKSNSFEGLALWPLEAEFRLKRKNSIMHTIICSVATGWKYGILPETLNACQLVKKFPLFVEPKGLL
jgi:hypothetical protein